MKTSRTLLFIGLLGMMTSCTGLSQSDGNGNSADSIPDTLDEHYLQSEDHHAIWQADSAAEMDFTTYDLAAMEVRGHVKRITTSTKFVVDFDQEGRITSMRDECSDYTLDHNADGNLTIYALGAGSCCYSINPETDLLACYSGGEGAYSWTNWYEYDSKGNLVAIEYNEEDAAEETTTSTKQRVTILERDEHNNWTRRRVGKQVETRTITYHPNALTLGDTPAPSGTDFNPFRGGYSFAGSIGGDEHAILTFVDRQGTYVVNDIQRTVSVDTYDTSNGQMVIQAYRKSSGEHLGRFDGTYSSGTYAGTFTNDSGGSVPFKLRLQH